MGSKNKEVKDLEKKAAEKAWPVENKDYYLVRIPVGRKIPRGYLTTYQTKEEASKYVLALMTGYKQGSHVPQKQDGRGPYYQSVYAVYPGVKPDKKWGPVCP